MSLTIQRVAKCPKQLNVVYCNVYQTKTSHHFHGFRENSTEYQPNSLTKLLPMSFKTSFEWASSYILNSNFHFREIDLCLKWTEVSIQTEKPSKHITSRFAFENSSSILQQLLFWVCKYSTSAQLFRISYADKTTQAIAIAGNYLFEIYFNKFAYAIEQLQNTLRIEWRKATTSQRAYNGSEHMEVSPCV